MIAFLPSANAFKFKNDWPHAAAFTVDVGGVDVPVGNAQRGLCGGMVFAARDYFETGRPLPGDTSAPGSGPLYEYIGQRLKESFGLPLGPAKYLELMATSDADRGPWLLRVLLGMRWRGIAWRTIRGELGAITDDLDHNHLVCLGLVCVHSTNPLDLGHNHQVLAYGYSRAGDVVTIRVYDPNRPLRDDVSLQFSTADPAKATPIDFVNGSEDVRGFFRVPYTVKPPPQL